MKLLDRWIQHWRAARARPWISGERVLDIGCHRGEFLVSLGRKVRERVGFDPLTKPCKTGGFTLYRSQFPVPSSFASDSFDSIVMLATLEHIREKTPLVRECLRILRPYGRMILTVPSRGVDLIVNELVRFRLADGMSLDQHHGYDPRDTLPLFAQEGFELEHRSRFQFGLNHLFVFRKPLGAITCRAGSPAMLSAA